MSTNSLVTKLCHREKESYKKYSRVRSAIGCTCLVFSIYTCMINLNLHDHQILIMYKINFQPAEYSYSVFSSLSENHLSHIHINIQICTRCVSHGYNTKDILEPAPKPGMRKVLLLHPHNKRERYCYYTIILGKIMYCQCTRTRLSSGGDPEHLQTCTIANWGSMFMQYGKSDLKSG